ncbi:MULTISPECIES: DUF3562 domain-containing protein [Paraburkholderia]|nr:DUF3562 domain-containing protein [Paraburkholderia tropica]MBB2979768.1 hypothetical protein [Paraburkholderia tropica]MBB3000633.1 hypothetical protein [Paraburkholderia tropica]MBB6320262.1 hypothetical protein [Paraburkholderia tropica]MDE1143755.1 DUF3562 domain-containing protein [Paraburkholderia tropica]OBR53249.1 hypothetical protein A6456_14635 [Paraburkholderia tropica]
MKTQDFEDVIREIAALTATSEEVVAQMYTEALERFRKDARVFDYIPLLAEKRVREALRIASKIADQ